MSSSIELTSNKSRMQIVFEERAKIFELTPEKTAQEFSKFVRLLQEIKPHLTESADATTQLKAILHALIHRSTLSAEEVPFDYEGSSDLLIRLQKKCQNLTEQMQEYAIHRMLATMKTLAWPPVAFMKM